MASTAEPGDPRFATLVAAIRAELAALAVENAPAIEAATAAKTAALQAVTAAVAQGVTPPRALLEEARDLNAEAALRARVKLVGIERQLRAIDARVGRPAALVYGRDGRWA
ncbi:MAG: hypothetical protein ACOYKQ_02605 [Polymorphobacter sp.]